MRDDLLWFTAYAGFFSASILIFIVSGAAPLRNAGAWVSREAQIAAAFFVQSITVAQIQNDYRGVSAADPTAGAATAPVKKVRVLIVPGHQPTKGGTEFGGVYERNVAVDIADVLAKYLSQNPHYNVMVARTKSEWNPILQNYFDTYALEIDTFRQSLATQMKSYLADGSILPEVDQVYHDRAPSEAVRQLYGINKWTSDNGYDITLHLHINDDAEHRARVAGEYDGFAVYVPNRQYSNAEASKMIGEAIAVRLNAYHATSTLPKEGKGVVEDQQLIATGSNNSASNAALLIEYGYMYEPQFQNESARSLAVADYAYQTYLGLQDFFKDPISPTYGSISFPYDWTRVTAKKNERSSGVYALQAALHFFGCNYIIPISLHIGKLLKGCCHSTINAALRISRSSNLSRDNYLVRIHAFQVGFILATGLTGVPKPLN